MLKLRSMREEGEDEARWSSEADSRVTRVGRFMRKTHLDEVPQIVNVLRGDMSIVGPRPEQPEFVAHLERTIPFYARRHLTRPGVSGWAQIHCGYAGSDSGSAWKLSHDLYYLRHRSAVLDLMILCETLRTLFADRQYAGAPSALSFVVPEESAIGEVS
jgi:lipopolysaccharide/colanic/teichoic acid biosynthesis glycosyltransferase